MRASVNGDALTTNPEPGIRHDGRAGRRPSDVRASDEWPAPWRALQPAQPSRRPSAASVLAVLGGLILAFAAAARLAPVRERGRLLPFFEEYEVVRVDLLGVPVYADTSFGIADVTTAAVLAVLATALLGTARALHARGRREARPVALAGAGTAFLVGDDLLAAHETLGHNLGALASLPVVDHPDDLIVAAYLVVALAFAWRHRDLVRGAPRGPWALALVLAGAAAIHDLLPLHLTALEESAELGASLALLAAVGATLRRLLARP